MLKDRKQLICSKALDGSIIDNHTQLAVLSGRCQEIDDLLNTNFEEMMGEQK